MKSGVARPDGADTCAVCAMTWRYDVAKERRQHARLHTAALAARSALAGVGPLPLPISYDERERIKLDAEDLDPATCAVRIMWSHFARSLCGLDYDLERHPSWRRYAMAYVAQPWFGREYGAELQRALTAHFSPGGSTVLRPHPALPDGQTDWNDR